MLIQLWVPALDSAAGGIQTYSAHLRDGLQTLGHQCEVIAHNGKRSTFIAKALLNALIHPVDLIISTHLNFSPLAHFLKKRRGIPYAISLHGIEAWTLPNPRIQNALRSAAALLPVSAFTEQRFCQQMGTPLPPLELLHNTVDPERFQIHTTTRIRQLHGIDANAPLILTIGRMSRAEAYKGHDTLIQALPEVLTRHPQAVYLIVGEGDDRPRLEKLANDLHIATQVLFVGQVSGSDLPAYYQSCDVFAMPSQGEGFGIVYLEAMACGKPVIAGNLDAGLDTLDNGRLGITIDPNSPDQAATAINACLKKNHPNRLLFEPALLREAMLNKFGPESFQKKLGQILESLSLCAA